MKMKILFLLCIYLMLGSVGMSLEELSVTNDFMDYKIADNKFSVVALQKEGISKEETKQSAIHRAAEIAKQHGYEYFVLESEHEVQVYQSKPNWPTTYDFPGNLYQEEIQEQNFNRDRTYEENMTGPQELPGYQIVVECYSEKPKGSSYSVCDYVECPKK